MLENPDINGKPKSMNGRQDSPDTRLIADVVLGERVLHVHEATFQLLRELRSAFSQALKNGDVEAQQELIEAAGELLRSETPASAPISVDISAPSTRTMEEVEAAARRRLDSWTGETAA